MIKMEKKIPWNSSAMDWYHSTDVMHNEYTFEERPATKTINK